MSMLEVFGRFKSTTNKLEFVSIKATASPSIFGSMAMNCGGATTRHLSLMTGSRTECLRLLGAHTVKVCFHPISVVRSDEADATQLTTNTQWKTLANRERLTPRATFGLTYAATGGLIAFCPAKVARRCGYRCQERPCEKQRHPPARVEAVSLVSTRTLAAVASARATRPSTRAIRAGISRSQRSSPNEAVDS